ncbi:MepB family protein [Pseudomonas sp. PSPC3-3]|uniref:MepB family protein n=1 Tax=unclassified Pseudomonas TaxID=196821 RepID=UPI003CF7335A
MCSLQYTHPLATLASAAIQSIKVQSMGTSVVPSCLFAAIDAVYLPAGLKCSEDISPDVEAREYGGCRFMLGTRQVVFRVAKTTPTKIGQFVTLWKRPYATSVIAPLDSNDNIDFVVIHATGTEQSGQFVFDRATLLSHGVMSINGVGGKRALRVYPPWSRPIAKQALQTQRWQLQHFVTVDPSDQASLQHIKSLFRSSLK